ncbi:MAG: GNAT family N-acetyltransferase [Erysipelotrichales bacterium]|nr:GNAT family N-acetyltransferase [Erysipelotrichales bacterium]
MPISGVNQPLVIQIDENLRLRRYDGNHEFAFEWYQDIETIKLVDGVEEPYSIEQLFRMYSYLNDHGELYFIEFCDSGKYFPIGDVTFWKDDLPIVIGDSRFRGKGIGKKVVATLIDRGKELGYSELYVGEIYSYNIGSIKLFESLGFKPYKNTEKGKSYKLVLKDIKI